MNFTKKTCITVALAWCAFSISCSGAVEQPGFVNIFLQENNTDTLKEFELLKHNVIKLTFDDSVSELKVKAVRSSSGAEIECSTEVEKNAYGTVFSVKPLEEFDVGEQFTLKGSASSKSNVLDFSLPFEGINSHPARLAFSEIKLGSAAKAGYIKMKVLSEGNLHGLNLVSVADTKHGDYIFPSAEVKKNETIVYHWFLPQDEEKAVDEVSSALQSRAEEAFAGERDFWGRFKKFIPKKTNVILLKTSKTGAIQDAAAFIHPDAEEWESSDLEQAVQAAVKEEKWQPDAEPENAIRENITPASWIERISLTRITHSAKDWEKKTSSRKKKPKAKKR